MAADLAYNGAVSHGAPTPAESPTTFISYAREDAAFALKLAADLRKAGANIWIDRFDIPVGKNWPRAVQEALDSCSHFLIILSPTSVGSDNVLAELNFALDEGKQIFPVLYQECKRPFRVRAAQYADFTAGYQTEFSALLKAMAVEQMPETVAEPLETAPSTVKSSGVVDVTPSKTEPLHPVVVRMLEQLKSSDVRLRLEALDQFHKRAQADPVAMRAIVEALLDPDLRVRARAARAAMESKLSSDEAVSNLIGLLNTRRDETPGERRDAAGLRAMAAHALGALGPAAKVAAPDLLESLEDWTSVAEQAAIALVKMGVTGDPRFRKALIKLVGEESWAATSILLEMGPEAVGYVPSLIEMLRASAVTGNWRVKLQGYVIEVLSQTGEPGMSALEQSLTNGTPQEQVVVLDRDGRVTYLNHEAARIVKFPAFISPRAHRTRSTRQTLHSCEGLSSRRSWLVLCGSV